MTQNLSPQFEQMLGPSTARAEDVLQLSSYYHTHAGKPTPWNESFAVPAYLSYFLPLNYARLRAVFAEVRRFLKTEEISEIWDFGSGPGTTQWALEDDLAIASCPLICVETSRAAIQVHSDLLSRRPNARFRPQFGVPDRKPLSRALAIFSYSFLEMQPSLEKLAHFDHLLIVEPSTREGGRALMEWRGRFIEKGFEALAPCTHQEGCPLLNQSPRDWCHMRVGFDGPDWFLRLEKDLPMKNRTLTYSYLLLSRAVKRPVQQNITRVIGDTLEEKGKTRQMICRGPEREFLSWLHRYGEPPRIPHGALLSGIETCESKGNELRVKPESQLTWQE